VRWTLEEARARGVPEGMIWREARVARGAPLAIVAGLVGVATSTLQRWERGLRRPRPGRADRLAAVLRDLRAGDPLPPSLAGRTGRPVGS